MTNPRHKRLMQEALDDNLNPERLSELREQIDRDNQAASEYQRLRQVDHMLRTAPHERAPRELAARIMTRLAQVIRPQQLSRLSGLALALSLSLVALVMMPLLIGLAWLVLSVIGSAAGLNSLLQQVVNLLALGIASLELFVQQVQNFVATNPEVPLVLIGLIPISVFWLLRSDARGTSGAGEANSP
jgi:anti-sigma factor RsiW